MRIAHHDRWPATLLLALATSCLSTPDPAGDGGAGSDDAAAGDGGSGIDAGGDAMANECGNVGDYTPQVWPPSTPVGVRDVVATDVNGDGNVDIVVTNGAVGDTDYLGFWVLLGPQSDPDNLVFHAFAASAAYPRSVTMQDVLGSGCADVTTFGENTANTAGFVEVFENVGPPEMFAAAPVLKDIGFTPVGDAVPVHVVYAALDTDSVVNDLVVGDLGEMYVLYITGNDFATELATGTAVRVGNDGTDNTIWSNVNAIFPRPSISNPAVDDLVVVELNDITWLFNNEARGFGDTTPYTLDNSFAFTAFGVVDGLDYDMMGPLDIIGGGAQTFGAYTIDDTSGIDAQVLDWQSNVPSDDGNIDDITAGDLGGQEQPEVVLLDSNETTGSHVFLIDGTFMSGTQIMPTTFDDFDLTGESIDPIRIVLADFNGDQSPELWAFDDVGNAVCLEREPNNPVLRLCQ